MWIVSRRSVVDVTAITARISANEIKLAAKAMRIVGKREEYLLLRPVEAHLDSSTRKLSLSSALGNWDLLTRTKQLGGDTFLNDHQNKSPYLITRIEM